MPNSVSMMISFIVFFLLITCIKLYSGTMFNSTFTFAMPRSPSIRITFFPSWAYAIAIFTAKFVFPTPPFPLVIAIILVLWSFFTLLLSGTESLCKSPSLNNSFNPSACSSIIILQIYLLYELYQP